MATHLLSLSCSFPFLGEWCWHNSAETLLNSNSALQHEREVKTRIKKSARPIRTVQSPAMFLEIKYERTFSSNAFFSAICNQMMDLSHKHPPVK